MRTGIGMSWTWALLVVSTMLAGGCEPGLGIPLIPVADEDVSGTWSGTALVPGRIRPVPATMDLLQYGDELTGALDESVPLVGTIDGDLVFVSGSTVIDTRCDRLRRHHGRYGDR